MRQHRQVPSRQREQIPSDILRLLTFVLKMVFGMTFLFLLIGGISILSKGSKSTNNSAPNLEYNLKNLGASMKTLQDALKKLAELKEMEDKLKIAFPEEPLEFEFSGFNNPPGATGEEDEDWISSSDDMKQYSDPKFTTVHGSGVVGFLWKIGFDKGLLQGLSSGQIMKSNNAWDAQGFCAGKGYSLISFESYVPYSEIDFKKEIVQFEEWFYPGMTKEGKYVWNFRGTGGISARTECISLVYGRLVETEKIMDKIDFNSGMLHVEKGHFFNCCKM